MALRPLAVSLFVLTAALLANRVLVVDPQSRHLRTGEEEWSEFGDDPQGSRLELPFDGQTNAGEQTLLVRHADVRHNWRVRLNDRELGRFVQDENAIESAFRIPAGAIKDGRNVVVIEGLSKNNDDITAGDVRIDPRTIEERLANAQVALEVVDAEGNALPCRITVVDAVGSLPAIGARSDAHLAVRHGVVYTADGRAKFGLPAGKYTLYATRGFEYSVADAACELATGDVFEKRLTLRREVDTTGLVAIDTHIHTRTFSGHGDATVDERAITIAGEGIEMAVATDHNVHADYEPAARKTGTRDAFTPVGGNEVTTRLGHFNAFPVVKDAPVPDWKQAEWAALLPRIRGTPNVRVVTLNHPRDVHSGFVPFGPGHFNAAAGQMREGFAPAVDGIEVITSAALQSDIELLFRDWFALLNRGHRLAPIASSDSHDVNRYILGQGRTYVPAPDEHAERIDVDAVCQALRKGRATASLGLLAQLEVNGRFGPGDLVPADEELAVRVRVRGPHWTQADRVTLYANGLPVQTAAIAAGAPRGLGGLQFDQTWTLKRPRHDVYLVAVASGPGVRQPFWRIPKPYQASSRDWNPRVISATGAVWIDADRDGLHQSCAAYASALMKDSGGDLGQLIKQLADYDQPVAVQAFHAWQQAGHPLLGESMTLALRTAAPQVQRGYQQYLRAWRECQQAQASE